MRGGRLLAGAATLALGLIATQAAAQAAVMTVLSNTPLSASPIVVALGTGTFSFTADNSQFFPMSSVATGGTGLVTKFMGGVTDFGTASPIDGTGLFTFASFPTATSIPTSATDDFVGFSYTAAGQTHYGFAEVFGTSFVGYAYETAANTTILTQNITSTTPAAVPEPASAALLIAGMTMVGLARRGKRSGMSELAA